MRFSCSTKFAGMAVMLISTVYHQCHLHRASGYATNLRTEHQNVLGFQILLREMNAIIFSENYNYNLSQKMMLIKLFDTSVAKNR